MMNNNVVVTQFKVLSQQLAGWADKGHGMGIEPGKPVYRRSSANCRTVVLIQQVQEADVRNFIGCEM